MKTRPELDDQIDASLRTFDDLFDVMAIGQRLIPLLTKQAMTLDMIECRLRAIGSNTYFVVKRAEDAPAGLVSMSVPDNKRQPYWLWICLHGAREAAKERDRLGMSEADNLEALKHAGFLVVNAN